ncbi:IS3 family transposase [Phaeobacter gallaeciensis]|uniref:Transposase n=2 Tax=Phaeobacter gallaeciensis TaxID=60890 RepID=A0AAD0ECC7_9RHOB|nr:IS3 family transposase [Phaeobacter gallaeciensis]AHD08917.1 Transposase [Phaeobacter gallaeciensis DSM 26640]ATE92183.1 Transposase [Phaeobacter gallaeciensis]ATE97998.1 Transposase [Phaeobacter gallaeciensis]ATF00845.1 Transposase [Phaeobacter gallaeciensis]ATF05225.1 Transposase [Phaeobacter gallaeciensis]
MNAKRAFVAAHKTVYPIVQLCRLVGVARSWFYGFVQSQLARDQRHKLRTDRDAELLPKIKEAFSQSKKRYGSKRVHQDLKADGEDVSERRVARIMRENNVTPRPCKRRKPCTTDSNHSLKPSPNLLEQRFACTGQNRVWLTDITYVDTKEGWLYVAAIKDMATREIVGWAMDDHLRSELCCDALNMALGRRGPVPGLIHHSDRGVQYAGSEYRKLLGAARITQSMSRTGECLDNAPMESFFASLKKELVHRERFKTRA